MFARHLARGAARAGALHLDAHGAVFADADQLGVSTVGDEPWAQQVEHTANLLRLRDPRSRRVYLPGAIF